MRYNMLYSRPFPLLCLNVHLAGNPRDASAQTQAASVPSSPCAPSQAPEERDVDLEDYHYERYPAVDGGSQAENWLAAYWQGFLTSTQKSWRLCCATC